VQLLSRLTPSVVNEKWPLKNRMLSWKCRESASVLDHSLMSSGIGLCSARLICPLRQQKPGHSRSNLLALQCKQFGTCSKMFVFSGRFEYTKSKGSMSSAPDKPVGSSGSMSSASEPTHIVHKECSYFCGVSERLIGKAGRLYLHCNTCSAHLPIGHRGDHSHP
jgi:hypothetical protein